MEFGQRDEMRLFGSKQRHTWVCGDSFSQPVRLLFPVNSKNHIELQYIIKQGWKFGLEDLEQEELSVKLGYMALASPLAWQRSAVLLGSGSPVSASIACCVNR